MTWVAIALYIGAGLNTARLAQQLSDLDMADGTDCLVMAFNLIFWPFFAVLSLVAFIRTLAHLRAK